MVRLENLLACTHWASSVWRLHAVPWNGTKPHSHSSPHAHTHTTSILTSVTAMWRLNCASWNSEGWVLCSLFQCPWTKLQANVFLVIRCLCVWNLLESETLHGPTGMRHTLEQCAVGHWHLMSPDTTAFQAKTVEPLPLGNWMTLIGAQTQIGTPMHACATLWKQAPLIIMYTRGSSFSCC